MIIIFLFFFISSRLTGVLWCFKPKPGSPCLPRVKRVPIQYNDRHNYERNSMIFFKVPVLCRMSSWKSERRESVFMLLVGYLLMHQKHLRLCSRRPLMKTTPRSSRSMTSVYRRCSSSCTGSCHQLGSLSQVGLACLGLGAHFNLTRVLPCNSNSMEIWFYSDLHDYKVIATIFGTWHDSMWNISSRSDGQWWIYS